MRFSYLVCYDICDEKRLGKVFQAMRGCADHCLRRGRLVASDGVVVKTRSSLAWG
jgi:predicted kinase